VGQAFLGAHGHDHFLVVVQLHVEAVAVPVGHGLPQAVDALGSAVAVVDGLLHGLHELVHHVLGRGQVGVAHAQVHDVGALVAQLHLELVDRGENIGRQTVYPGELVHGRDSLALSADEVWYEEVSISRAA